MQGNTGRHETFTPRYGWLKKGYDRTIANSHVFNDDDAIEQLGVGKNMVRSIRFWCLLLGLLEDAGIAGSRPSEFGKNLLDTEHGWDPYLEDPASCGSCIGKYSNRPSELFPGTLHSHIQPYPHLLPMS